MLEATSRKEFHQKLLQFKGRETVLLNEVKNLGDSYAQVQALSFVFATQKQRILKMILDLEIAPTIVSKVVGAIVAHCSVEELVEFLQKAPKGLQLKAIDEMMRLRKKGLIQLMLRDNPLRLERSALVGIFHGASTDAVSELLPQFENDSIVWLRVLQFHDSAYLKYLEDQLTSCGEVLQRHYVWDKQFLRLNGTQWYHQVPRTLRKKMLELYLKYPPLVLEEGVRAHSTLKPRHYILKMTEKFLDLSAALDVSDVLGLLQEPPLSHPGIFSKFRIGMVDFLLQSEMRSEESAMVLQFISGKAQTLLSRVSDYHEGCEDLDETMYWTQILVFCSAPGWLKSIGLTKKLDTLRSEYQSVFLKDVKDYNQVLPLVSSLTYQTHWSKILEDYVSKKVVHFFTVLEDCLYAKLGNIVEEFAMGLNVDQKLLIWANSFKSHLQILNSLAETLVACLESCPLEYKIPIQKQLSVIFSAIQKSLEKLRMQIGSLGYRYDFNVLDSRPLEGPLAILADNVKSVYEGNSWITNWTNAWQGELFQYLERAVLSDDNPTKYEIDLYGFLEKNVLRTWYFWLYLTKLEVAQAWVSRSISFLNSLKERTLNQPLEQRLCPNADAILRTVFSSVMDLLSRYVAVGIPIHDFMEFYFLSHCFEIRKVHDWSQFKANDLSQFFVQFSRHCQKASRFCSKNPIKLEDLLNSSVIDLLVDLGVQCLHAPNVWDYRVKAMEAILTALEQRTLLAPLVLPLVTRVIETACTMPALHKTLRMYSLENWTKGMEENLDQVTAFEMLYLNRLSVLDPKVMRYVQRKQSFFQDLGVKVNLFQKMMDNAVRQSRAFPDEEDFPLEVSKWMQPLTTRVEWHLKGISHPFLSIAHTYIPNFVGKQNHGILADDRVALRPTETLSHAKAILEHLKSLCEDRFRSEPLKYVNFVNDFVEKILEWSCHPEYFFQFTQKYRIGRLPFLQERLEVRELWTRFGLELKFDAFVKSRGISYAISTFRLPKVIMVPTKTYLDNEIQGIKRKKLSNRIRDDVLKNIFLSVENLVYDVLRKIAPTYPLFEWSGEYNEAVVESIKSLLIRALTNNAITQKIVGVLGVLTKYLTTSVDKRDSIVWKRSLNTFQDLPINDFLRAEGERLSNYSGQLGTSIPFTRILIEDYKDPQKIAFLELYLKTSFALWSKEMKPVVADWIHINIALAQYKAPTRAKAVSRHLVVNTKLSCVEKLLALCPSAAVLRLVQECSLSHKPSLILDVMRQEYNKPSSKFYSKGIFNSDMSMNSTRLIFPMGGDLTKWNPDQKSFMMNVCRECLLDKDESIERKILASEWLGKGKISNTTVIHDLFLQLLAASKVADNPVPFEPIIKKNLLTGLVHQVDEFATVLKIILTKEILEDRDVNVFLIDALSGFGNLIGDQFTSALRDTLFAAEGLISQLGVAAMKALVRLIKDCSNSVDILIHLFERYPSMNESVACYLLTTICEILNDENEDHQAVWDTIQKFVDNQTKVDNKILMLFAVLLHKYPPDHVVDVEYRKVFFPSGLLQTHIGAYQLPGSPALRDTETSLNYFERIISRIYEKNFAESTPLTEKLRCMAASALPNWFGIDSQLNLRIVETVNSYCNNVLMPWSEKDDTGFLTVSVPLMYGFVVQVVAYYNNLKTKGLAFEDKYLSIPDVYSDTIDNLFSRMDLETLTEQEKYSNVYKLDLILGLSGMKKRIAQNLDENDVTKKRKVHLLIGNVYEKITRLTK
jgi:hypothetical protein